MWYKIVEKHPNGIKTLFHGNNGSRFLETNMWIKANEKMVIDGSDGRTYLSGWHVLKSYDEAVSFLNKKFRKRKELLYIVPCKAKNIRVKPSNPMVFLAKWIRIERNVIAP